MEEEEQWGILLQEHWRIAGKVIGSMVLPVSWS